MYTQDLQAKFSATTLTLCLVKTARVSIMLLQKFLNWKHAQKKNNHCRQKVIRRDKGKTIKQKKLKDVVTYCTCPSKNVVKCSASGKKGMLSCGKCTFEYIGANLDHIQAENLQNVQKVWQ